MNPADAAHLAALRAPFPHLRDCAYLDTAAAGLTWQGQGAAVARFYDEVKSRGIDARPEWLALTQKLRSRLAALLKLTPSDLTFVSNTTEGVNLAAHSLRWQAGDRVAMAADEFPSIVGAFEAVARHGVQIVRVDVPRETEREAALLSALDARPRVLAVSQTHWSTGTTLDLQRLGRSCHEAGTLLLVDGIQALGAVPTDLTHVDIYVASFFKWMLSGFGVGVLATSPLARQAMEPAYRGYANHDDPTQLQYAHVNIPALYGLDATLDFFESVGWPVVYRRVRELGDHVVAGAARHGLDLLTPAHARAGIFAFRADDAETLRARLAARRISVSARGQGVRLSPHYYNLPEEIDRCLAALAEAGHP